MSSVKKEDVSSSTNDDVVILSDDGDESSPIGESEGDIDTDGERENRQDGGDSENADEENALPPGFPPVEVCAERCRTFSEVTDTNEALAQFFLQDNDWDLERAVQDYYQQLAERNGADGSAGGDAMDGQRAANSSSGDGAGASHSSAGGGATSKVAEVVTVSSDDDDVEVDTTSDDLLKVISWNIDGLDPKNVEIRTRSVCAVIKQAQADVVMLQEVIPHTFALIENLLSRDFHVLHSGLADYFTAVLVHKRRMKLGTNRVFEFNNSSMGRTLHVVEASFKGRHQMFFFNSHLESTAEFSDARKAQLKKCFAKMDKIPSDIAVLFAGDLNLRDKEVDAVGGLPSGVVDMWADQGSRPEAKFTWDLKRNDNLLFNGKFKPQMRFDRMYYKRSSAQATQLRPAYFGLIGLERLLPHRCFPSDHWGLYAHFKLIN